MADKCGFCGRSFAEIGIDQSNVWHVIQTTGNGEVLLFEGWFCGRECADRKTFVFDPTPP
jgi:hypothetical protein